MDAYYGVDRDGMPVLLDPYHFFFYSDYTTVTELNATMETGSGTEAVVIPSGTLLFLIGSDTETFVDMMDENGVVYTIEYDGSSYPHLIDGKDEVTVFMEGDVVYAG